MKTFLKVLGLVFIALYFTACGGGSGGAAAQSVGPVIVGDPIYTMKVTGASNTFACSFITNFGDADQGELLTGMQAVTTAAPMDWTVTGRNMVGQCSQHTGPGMIAIETYKDGVLVGTVTSAGNATSAHFNVGI